MRAQRKIQILSPLVRGTKPKALAAVDTYILSAAFVVSFSGVAYELLLATYTTYLWGGTVYQYSLVFSSMMLAMGIGSWLADRSGRDPISNFIVIECVLSLLGVLCLPVLYWVYAAGFAPLFFVFGFSLVFGLLVGLEIPLLNRWLGREKKVAELLAVDFAGGFLGGVLFPLFLVPYLGLFRVAATVALLNALIASLGNRYARRSGWAAVACVVTSLFAVLFFIFATRTQHWLEFRYFGF